VSRDPSTPITFLSSPPLQELVRERRRLNGKIAYSVLRYFFPPLLFLFARTEIQSLALRAGLAFGFSLLLPPFLFLFFFFEGDASILKSMIGRLMLLLFSPFFRKERGPPRQTEHSVALSWFPFSSSFCLSPSFAEFAAARASFPPPFSSFFP